MKHALAESLVRLFEACYLVGLQAEGESARQLVETKGNLDDAGKVEAASRAALHKCSCYQQHLFAVVFDVTEGTKQEEEARQRVDTNEINHLFASFGYAQNVEELLYLFWLRE